MPPQETHLSATPLMQQYFEIKKNFSDAFVFFQVGEFYELFFDDAERAAQFLGITLTKRGVYKEKPIPLCGVPLHTASHYYLKLVKSGYRVALCNQTEIAQPGKLVQRAVSEIITPATIISEQGLDEKKSSLIAFINSDESHVIIAVVEFILQHVQIVKFEKNASLAALLTAELERIRPDECVIASSLDQMALQMLTKAGYHATCFDDNNNGDEQVDQWMSEHKAELFYKPAVSLFLKYMHRYYPHMLSEYTYSSYESSGFLTIDAASQQHLELVANKVDGLTQGTLYDVLDQTETSMGSRLLRSWILYPLRDHLLISERHLAIKALIDSWHITKQLAVYLKLIGDLERAVGRIRLQRAHYNDYKKIAASLKIINEFKNNAQAIVNPLLHKNLTAIENFNDLSLLLDHYLPSDTFSDEYKIRPDADSELTKLAQYMHASNEILIAYESKEQKRTGISGLKIRSTPFYGYVIEISKTHNASIPSDYIRVQTLTNRERYTHPELKSIEYEILNAKEAYQKRDQELFEMITEAIYKKSTSLLSAARSCAFYDVLISLAKTAQKYNFVQPIMNNDASKCSITNGKHPVIAINKENAFVPNSLFLSKRSRTWIITGPNMGGKSTFMRQCALICIMAQCGSWVPADHASLPVLDSLFTRIGATDYVVKGKSTFFVEMEESALICAMACKNSFVILDEIGRGTSTYDGMSLAYAIVKYIHEDKQPFMLCATHYHELYDLFMSDTTIEWHHAATTKNAETGEIVLLHTIKKGHVSESMGIEIARRVGLPEKVLVMAQKTKEKLEIK